MAKSFNIDNPIWGISLIGYGVIVEGIAAIRQRMDIAIRTTKGTDPLRPEFGTNIYNYIDIPTDISVPNIKKEIIESIQLWVPEVKIISIKQSYPISYENPNFEITYRILDTDLIDKLLFDLQQGTTSVTDALNEIILQAFFPENPNHYPYQIRLEKNGSNIFPMPNPAGFTTIQSMFDWAKTNWFFVGKWYLLADKIVCYMNAEGVSSASLSISTLPVTIVQYDFPTLTTGQLYQVIFKVHGVNANPSPPAFSTPGDALAWVQDNWSNYADWLIEFLSSSEDGIFSDEFSDEFDVPATGYRLIGVSHIDGFEGELTINPV